MPLQRFRLTFARAPDAPDLTQREQLAAWSAALAATGLTTPDDPEPARLVAAAPIPTGLSCDAELADLFLPVRRTAADVRERLVAAMPAGHRLVDLYDVWLGEPALPGALVAADYRVRITSDGRPPDRAILAQAVAQVLRSATVERSRGNAAKAAAGNLRPLIADIRVEPDAGLWMRLRFDPNLGTGRPEEVVAAIAARAGVALEVVTRHRERLWLRGDGV
jgi:hypothetical protein